jgi:uncharacterized protein YqgV (UPF0045/DUF77 family)
MKITDDRSASRGGSSKGAGYSSSDVVGCQLSVYPLRQDDVGLSIRAAIEAARIEGCTVRVGNLSTLITGSEDQVFGALRAAFRAAQRPGSAVVVATLAAGIPSDELVAEIQEDVAPVAGRGRAAGAEGSRARSSRS